MKISIIIPIFKVESYIADCINSVLSQDYQNLEIILVDDASPDDSVSIAKAIVDLSPRKMAYTIVRHDNNRGLSAARNTGIETATGDYLYFLDSDDTLAAIDSISLLADAVDGYDVAIGNYRGVKSDSSYESKYNQKGVLKGDSLIDAFVKGDVPITAWNKLINRKYFDEGLRFMEGILNEDELFSYQLLFKNPMVVMIGAVTYNYSIRPGSIMTTFKPERLLSPIIVYEEASKLYRLSKQKDSRILVNLDHFAFKRYVQIMISEAEENLKKELYSRLRKAQKQIKGVGVMRYLFNSHLFLPKSIGFNVIKMISKHYAKSRRLQ